MRKLILIFSGEILPLSLFIRVSLRSKVSLDFFFKYVFILHVMLRSVRGRKGEGPWKRAAWQYLQGLIPAGLGSRGQWLSFSCPSSSKQKLPLVFPHHFSCEILIGSPPCPAYKTENPTSWGPIQFQVNEDRTVGHHRA